MMCKWIISILSKSLHISVNSVCYIYRCIAMIEFRGNANGLIANDISCSLLIYVCFSLVPMPFLVLIFAVLFYVQRSGRMMTLDLESAKYLNFFRWLFVGLKTTRSNHHCQLSSIYFSLSMCLFLCSLFIKPFIHLCIYLLISLFIHSFFHSLIRSYMALSIHCSIHLCIHLSIDLGFFCSFTY